MHLLESCVNQIALAIEVERLEEEKLRKLESRAQENHIRTLLLQTVSQRSTFSPNSRKENNL